MAKRKVKDTVADSEHGKEPIIPDYVTSLVIKRDKEGVKQAIKWQREHAARLRRLEREARGELVPGDYDCTGEAYS